MRKLLVLLFAMAYSYAIGQGNTLYSVLRVTPKIGKTSDFEMKWKTHLAKFHAKDDSRAVYEIISGNMSGSYLLVSGPRSFADFDKESATDKAHDQDYDMSVTPAVDKVGGSDTYRWADSLSYNGDVAATKFSTTIYRIKPGKMGELTDEIKKAIVVNKAINSPVSTNTYIKMMAGSNPELVTIANLKDGFKQLDSEVTGPRNTAFREEYQKRFGQQAWTKRLNLLTEITESYETYLSKYRKDMSTVAK